MLNKLEIKKDFNVQFAVLTFLATLLVVFGHTGISFGTFEWIFHYDTFHMPLFVFISGYFFKSNDVSIKNAPNFIIKKTKKLIIPFFIFNLVYGMLALYFYKKFNIQWCHGNDFWYNLLIQPFTNATDFFGFNSPSWFVLMLFWVEINSYLLYLLFKKFKYKHIIVTLLCFVASLFLIHLSRNGYRATYIIFFTRTIYMMFWFSVGIIYKNYLEKYDRISNLKYFTIVFFVQFVILIINEGHEMNAFIFNGTFTQNGLITIILAANGIALYLRISKILCPSLGKLKLVNCIQKNSFNIMMNQMLGFFILNLIFFKLSNYYSFIQFDYNSFIINQFYRVYPFGHPGFGILYVIFGVGISLFISFIIDCCKIRIKELKNQNMIKI